MKRAIQLLTLLAAAALSGCSSLGGPCMFDCGRQNYRSSSLVEFLYGRDEAPPANDAVPQLTLPLRVGLAMLPSHGSSGAPGLEAARQQELLENVRQRFLKRPFIREIVIIPEHYLGSTGFDSLQSLQRLYSVDVIALVSYDQVVYSAENNWSLGYLTIVGAFVLKGTHSDIATLLDLAVVDPATRSLLLRAGGTSEARRNTTAIEHDAEIRQSQASSFSLAAERMTDNFDKALTEFETSVREGKARVRVSHSDGGGNATGGGGALDFWALLLLAIPLASRISLNARNKRARAGLPC